MIVKVVVRVKEDRASARHLVHATGHEPVAVDAEQGILAFDLPYLRVEAVLNQLARSGVAELDAHLRPRPDTQDSAEKA